MGNLEKGRSQKNWRLRALDNVGQDPIFLHGDREHECRQIGTNFVHDLARFNMNFTEVHPHRCQMPPLCTPRFFAYTQAHEKIRSIVHDAFSYPFLAVAETPF